MSNAVFLLVSRPPGREVSAFPSVHLIEQNPLRKGNGTGGAFVQCKEVRAGNALQRRAEFQLGSGGSTEALAQQKLPRTRAKGSCSLRFRSNEGLAQSRMVEHNVGSRCPAFVEEGLT